jgi:FMN phosphatase YigB (HAD superfamily)
LYLIDLDDTLIKGPITFAFDVVIPKLIETYQLPFDEENFKVASLLAQKAGRDATGVDTMHELFEMMHWPNDLKSVLESEVFSKWVPELFPDTLPFLTRAKSRQIPVILFSNNNHAPDIATKLGIMPYLNGIFTPRICNVARGKPHLDMWNTLPTEITQSNPTLIGDDPYSDGEFSDAAKCKLILLDRRKRFQDMAYPQIASLDDLL